MSIVDMRQLKFCPNFGKMHLNSTLHTWSDSNRNKYSYYDPWSDLHPCYSSKQKNYPVNVPSQNGAMSSEFHRLKAPYRSAWVWMKTSVPRRPSTRVTHSARESESTGMHAINMKLGVNRLKYSTSTSPEKSRDAIDIENVCRQIKDTTLQMSCTTLGFRKKTFKRWHELYLQRQ